MSIAKILLSSGLTSIVWFCIFVFCSVFMDTRIKFPIDQEIKDFVLTYRHNHRKLIKQEKERQKLQKGVEKQVAEYREQQKKKRKKMTEQEWSEEKESNPDPEIPDVPFRNIAVLVVPVVPTSERTWIEATAYPSPGDLLKDWHSALFNRLVLENKENPENWKLSKLMIKDKDENNEEIDVNITPSTQNNDWKKYRTKRFQDLKSSRWKINHSDKFLNEGGWPFVAFTAHLIPTPINEA